MEPRGVDDFTLPEYLTCPVCADVLKDPRILPCSHTLCQQCLANEHAKDRSTPNDVSRRSVCCPLCGERSSVHSPNVCPRNRAIADAVEHWLVRSIRRDECLQLLASVAAAKERMQQDSERLPLRAQDGHEELMSRYRSSLRKGGDSQTVGGPFTEPLATFAKANDVCDILQTINSRHLEVLSIHCKYVDNLSNLQGHIQELLSLKFVAMRAMVKVNFADAMGPIERCRKSALRLTKELGEHFKGAESLAEDDVERFRQTDKVLACTLQRFLESSDKQTRDAVETFKAHLYKTVIDMETVKNALSDWEIRGAVSEQLNEASEISVLLNDANAEDDCHEEGGEMVYQQGPTVFTVLPKDSSTDMSASFKEPSSCRSETSTTRENTQQRFLHPLARFVEAQSLDPTVPPTRRANDAQTMTETVETPEASEGKSSPDWGMEAPGWGMVKPTSAFVATAEQSAVAETKQDPVQTISAGGRYFCPIVIPDRGPGPNDQQRGNVSDLKRTTERENPGVVETTSSDTLTEELPFDGMTLRTPADQDSCNDLHVTRSDAPYNLICIDTLSTMLIDIADTLGITSDPKPSEDEPKVLPSKSRKKRALSARDARAVLSPRFVETQCKLPSYKHLLNGVNLGLCDVGPSSFLSSDEYLGPWGRRRTLKQHQGAGEPYLAWPLHRYVPEQLRPSLMQPNCDSRSGLLRSLGRSHDTTFRMTEFQPVSGERDTSASSSQKHKHRIASPVDGNSTQISGENTSDKKCGGDVTIDGVDKHGKPSACDPKAKNTKPWRKRAVMTSLTSWL